MNPRKAGRETISVSFSGIDGAGKSTQIDALCAAARQAGLQVRLIRFWDDVARLTSLRESAGHKIFKGDKGIGSPDAPINRRDKNVRSGPMNALRLFLYFVDAVSLRRVVRKARASGADLVIFDRYCYDELANLKLSNPLMRTYARLLMRFVPRPHISYLLDADPVQARTRKPEYPIDFLHINRQSYLLLSELGADFAIMRPMPVEDVKREVLKYAARELSLGIHSREQSGEHIAEIYS